MTNELFLTILGSLLPIIITTVIAWLSNFGLRSKSSRVVTQAKQRVDFLHAYLTAQNEALGDSDELVRIKQNAAVELAVIKKTVEDEMRKIEKNAPQTGNFLHRFFLVYKMNNYFSGVFRVLFYLTLVLSFFWSMLFTNIFRDFIIKGTASIFVSIVDLLLFIAPAVAIVFLVRWLAIRTDKPRKNA